MSGSVHEIPTLTKYAVLDPDDDRKVGSPITGTATRVSTGTAGVLSRITGSIGSGVAVLTLDENLAHIQKLIANIDEIQGEPASFLDMLSIPDLSMRL